MSECSISHPKIPCFLTFNIIIKFNPYLPFEFLIILSFYMSDNKQLNVQKEFARRKTSGVHASSCKPMKMKERKNDVHVKMFMMELSWKEAVYKPHTKKW